MSKSSPTNRVTTRLAVGRPWGIITLVIVVVVVIIIIIVFIIEIIIDIIAIIVTTLRGPGYYPVGNQQSWQTNKSDNEGYNLYDDEADDGEDEAKAVDDEECITGCWPGQDGGTDNLKHL